MAEATETLEGWWALHDIRRVDWPAWRAATAEERARAVSEAAAFLEECLGVNGTGDGASGVYRIITQKGDLQTLHFRPDPAQLFDIELEFSKLRLAGYLQPAYSYFSVIELSRYGHQSEPNAAVMRRLHHEIPPTAYTCFYPMNKRRGEHVNWYDTPVEDRRKLMTGHGMIGKKYSDCVTQIVTGSQGLDDWEWGVTLFAEAPVYFKKLIYEMRFDPASSRYAEFGPFFIGRRMDPRELTVLLGIE